ncbi:BON domain-containing protein [Paracidovorax citrulli]
MRNDYESRGRRMQSAWPGYDERDDGWSDNRSERWAQEDWQGESDDNAWTRARRAVGMAPGQLSEGGPPRGGLGDSDDSWLSAGYRGDRADERDHGDYGGHYGSSYESGYESSRHGGPGYGEGRYGEDRRQGTSGGYEQAYGRQSGQAYGRERSAREGDWLRDDRSGRRDSGWQGRSQGQSRSQGQNRYGEDLTGAYGRVAAARARDHGGYESWSHDEDRTGGQRYGGGRFSRQSESDLERAYASRMSSYGESGQGATGYGAAGYGEIGYESAGEGYRDWGDRGRGERERRYQSGGVSEEGNFLGGRSRHADRPQSWTSSSSSAGQYRGDRGGAGMQYGGQGYGGQQYGTREYGGRGYGDRGYGDRGERGDSGNEEHGMLYELGHRIGEAVGGLFGQEPERRRVGPKGYQRSDERIHEAVCERLAYADGLDLSDVTVQVNGSVVKLTGSVRSRSEKFDIEDIADNVYGVTDVENEIRVRSADVSSPEKMTDLKNWTPD